MSNGDRIPSTGPTRHRPNDERSYSGVDNALNLFHRAVDGPCQRRKGPVEIRVARDEVFFRLNDVGWREFHSGLAIVLESVPQT